MADTLTTNLAITMFEQGSHSNTWGTDFNAAVTAKLDSCFGDKATISTTGGDTTLTATQIQTSYINVSGTLSATANLILPLLQKRLIWINNASVVTTAFKLNVKGTGGTSTEVPLGMNLIYWDGTTTAPLAFNTASGGTGITTIASAATTDLTTTGTINISITGVNTITGLGGTASTPAGIWRIARFTGILVLTHNAVSLILPGATNYTTAAGDIAFFVHLGSGNWACLDYTQIGQAPQNATAAEIWTGTVTKDVGVDQMWAAMVPVTLSFAASLNVDMSLGINFTTTLTGNVTAFTFTNATKVGQTGFIVLFQDGTGNRTLAFSGANWLSDNGVDPVLTTAPNFRDILFYTVVASNTVYVSMARKLS